MNRIGSYSIKIVDKECTVRWYNDATNILRFPEVLKASEACNIFKISSKFRRGLISGIFLHVEKQIINNKLLAF